MGRITLEGMRFHAHVGTTEQERAVGNDFEVCITYDCDTLTPGLSDRLEDAVDYSMIFDAVSKEMAVECQLIENLAHRILRRLDVGFPSIYNVHLRVCKEYPAVGGQLQRSVIEL